MSRSPGSAGVLEQALRLQTEAAAEGFDWPNIQPVLDKLAEELDELRAELQTDAVDTRRAEEELGDLLFSAVNLARHLGLDPNRALAGCNEKFTARFARVMADPSSLPPLGDPRRLEAMEARWGAAKAAE